MAIDLLPDLATKCVMMSTGLGEICIEFPGGAKVCANVGVDIGDPAEVIKHLLAQVNTALAPLQPFFNILDIFKLVMDCIQAIPDAIGPPPDPSGIINCVPGLVEKVNAILELLPPVSIPKMAKSILQAIITGLQGLRGRLAAIIAQALRVLAADLKAAKLGNFQLQVVADCAKENLDAYLENLNASMAPLNRLIGLLNVLLQLAGLDCIPALGALGDEISDAILAPLDAVIELLEQLLALIPALDLVLPTIVPEQCL